MTLPPYMYSDGEGGIKGAAVSEMRIAEQVADLPTSESCAGGRFLRYLLRQQRWNICLF